MMDDRQDYPIPSDFLNELKAQSTLEDFGFADWKAARTILVRMEARDPQGFSNLLSFLMAALGSSADPDRSLVNFERFMDSYAPEFFPELEKNPRVIEILVTLFSVSPFLTEILLRTPNALELLNNRQALTERKTIEQFQAEAVSATRPLDTDSKKLDALRRYQRRQYLRIGTNDFLGLYDLRAVFSQLSRMASGWYGQA